MERPTIAPSILVKGSRFTANGQKQYDEWRAGRIECPSEFESEPACCHSFVTDGKIQFLADCTHELAGKTVPLPDL